MNLLVKELIQPLLKEIKTIALYPGKFKPPHAGHFDVAKSLLGKADEIIVVISPVPVDGVTPQQSKSVWELYNKLLDGKLNIVIADGSPVKYVLNTIKNNPSDKFIAVFGKGEFDRYKSLTTNPNVSIYDGGTFKELNARDLRKALETGQDISKYLPDGVNERDFIKALSVRSIEESCGCQHSQQPTNFKQALASLTKYMLDQGLNISPLPKLKIINNDSKNAENILGRTAHYDPNDRSITLYTLNRHPKDVLRSYSHEMIHRIQDNEGRLNNVNTTNTNEDSNLQELEKEAYLNGNIIFRNWEDSIKNSKLVNEIYFLDIPKFNQPKTFVDKLCESLHEIVLSKNNAVEILGNLTDGQFTVGDQTYIYKIKEFPVPPYYDPGLFYNIEFHPKGNPISEPQGGKENYVKILSTMYKVILDFVEQEKPEYIGIASLDNEGSKNYHTIYANLTDNKFNRIPGYFRKDVGLRFDGPRGKGKMVVLKRKNEI